MAPLDHELPRTLDGLVGQLYSGGGHALPDHSALKELLELTDTASFTPRVAVHLLVTCNLAFVPLLCTEIKRLTAEGEEQREWAHNSVERGAALVWCVCLLKRLVENLVDKERELYKVHVLPTPSAHPHAQSLQMSTLSCKIQTKKRYSNAALGTGMVLTKRCPTW
jgi:hypothetical protein